MIATQAEWVRRLDELHLLTPLRVLAIVVVAIIVTVVMRKLVSRLLHRALALPGTDRTRLDARQRALTSTLKAALVGVIWAVAVITIISEVGVNIGGVVATATVIGGAVAFGAQTLVRDVISGFFVLAEDQYGVGDEVDLGIALGIVEKVTLRSVQLRDGSGDVWYVTHGNVVRVANLSRSPLAVLDLEVARTTPLHELDEAAAHLGAALEADVAAKAQLAGTPHSVGLIDLRDDRLVYRLSVPARPGCRDSVRRIWRTLALEAFERGDLVAPGATRQ